MMSGFHSREKDEEQIKEIEEGGLDKLNYIKWKHGRRDRVPANPYADPESPESQSVNDPNNPFLQRASNIITGYKKECRDGGKGQAEGNKEGG
jgi:hypothetical protein